MTNLKLEAKKIVTTIKRNYAKLGPGYIVDLANVFNMGADSPYGIDLSGTNLGSAIKKAKTTTLVLAQVLSLTYDENYEQVVSYKEVPENRFFRLMSTQEKLRASYQTVDLKDGKTVNIMINRPYIDTMKNILYVDFVSKGDKPGQMEAYEETKRLIKHGIEVDGILYKLALRSSASIRTGKAVFIRADYKLSEAELAEFEDERFRQFMSEQEGGFLAQLLVTYGSTATFFTGIWDNWNGINTKSRRQTVQKYMTRAGMGLSSSKEMGPVKVKHIGEVKVAWTEEIAEMYRNVYDVVNGKKQRRFPESEIEKIKNFWSESKHDGMNLVDATWFQGAYYKSFGIKLAIKDILGELPQARYYPLKGTFFAVDRKVLEACRDQDGNQIYKGYDVIAEDNSWKYDTNDFFTGKFAPQFELLQISKAKYSNNLSYQFIQALDGFLNNPKAMIEVFKGLIDTHNNLLKLCLSNPIAMKGQLGVLDKVESALEEFGIDEYSMTLTTKITKFISELDDAITDPYLRRKFLDLFSSMKEKMSFGRLFVDGATRFGITDPIALLRTDLMDKDMNIIITSPDQVALTGPVDYFWQNKTGPIGIFRNPMYHPGEAQVGKLVETASMKPVLKCKGFTIDVEKIYGGMRNVLVFSMFSFHLEALGGADVDGDKFLVVLDSAVIALRNPQRNVIFADISNPEAEEKMKDIINEETIIKATLDSLRSDNVGLLTNMSTTCRDIQQYALWIANYGGALPALVIKELKKLQKVARKNLSRIWAKDDPSIEKLANMDINNMMSVFNAMDACVGRFKVLGEMAIDTPKTSVYVLFEETDININNNLHLAIGIRPSWLKRTGKNIYDSLSTMGQVAAYVESESAKLYEHAREDGEFIQILKELEIPNLKEVSKPVSALSGQYQIEVRKLIRFAEDTDMDEEDFNEKFSTIAHAKHIALVALAEQFSVDAVALAVYLDSYKDTKQGRGGSFLWNCFFDEFLDVVKYYNGNGSRVYTRVHKVHKEERLYFTKIADGEVIVKKNKVYNEDSLLIGQSSVANGSYSMINVGDSLYISVEHDVPTAKELTVSLAGSVIKVVGMKFCDNPLAEVGVKFTKASVMQLLETDNLIKTKTGTIIDSYNKEKVVVTVHISMNIEGEQSWVRIGSIEAADSLVSRALDEKLIRVSFHKDEYKGNIPLTAMKLVVDEIVSHGDLEPVVEVSGIVDTIENHIERFTSSGKLTIGGKVFGLERISEFRAALWAKFVKAGGDMDNVVGNEDDAAVLQSFFESGRDYNVLLSLSSDFRAELRGESPAGPRTCGARATNAIRLPKFEATLSPELITEYDKF